MWTDFFIFGTIWFWLLLAIAGVVITVYLEAGEDGKDTNGTGATLTMIGFGVVYYFMGSSEHVRSIFQYIIANPLTIFLYLAGYYAVGVAWSITKWYFYLKFKAAKLNEQLDKYSRMDYLPSEFKVSASDKKGTIIAWMTYWPFSVVWTMVHKFVRQAFQYLYIKFEGVYNRISKSVFADVTAKFELKKAEYEAKLAAAKEEREKKMYE